MWTAALPMPAVTPGNLTVENSGLGKHALLQLLGHHNAHTNKLLQHCSFLFPFLTTRCREIITNSNFAVKDKLDSVIYRSAGKLRTERVYYLYYHYYLNLSIYQ